MFNQDVFGWFQSYNENGLTPGTTAQITMAIICSYRLKDWSLPGQLKILTEIWVHYFLCGCQSDTTALLSEKKSLLRGKCVGVEMSCKPQAPYWFHVVKIMSFSIFFWFSCCIFPTNFKLVLFYRITVSRVWTGEVKHGLPRRYKDLATTLVQTYIVADAWIILIHMHTDAVISTRQLMNLLLSFF